MNHHLLIATGVFLWLTALVHTALGGGVLMRHVSRQAFAPVKMPRAFAWMAPPEPDANAAVQKAYLRAIWHVIGVDALLSGGYMFAIAAGLIPGSTDALFNIALRFSGLGVLWVVMVCIPTHRWLRAPQWILTFVVAGMTLASI